MKTAINNRKPVLKAAMTVCALAVLAGCTDEEAAAPEKETVVVSKQKSTATTPEVLPSILKVNRQEKTYVITGIGLKGSNKVAIINNTVLKPGEEIDDGVVLEDIQPTLAIIRVGNTRHLLRPQDIQRELDKKKQ